MGCGKKRLEAVPTRAGLAGHPEPEAARSPLSPGRAAWPQPPLTAAAIPAHPPHGAPRPPHALTAGAGALMTSRETANEKARRAACRCLNSGSGAWRLVRPRPAGESGERDWARAGGQSGAERGPERGCWGKRLCGRHGGGILWPQGRAWRCAPRKSCLQWRREWAQRAGRVWEAARLREGELALEQQKRYR